MYEAIITEVVPQKENGVDKGELEIRNVGDVLEFRIDGELIFSGDWSSNFAEIFKRALEIWNIE